MESKEFIPLCMNSSSGVVVPLRLAAFEVLAHSFWMWIQGKVVAPHLVRSSKRQVSQCGKKLLD